MDYILNTDEPIIFEISNPDGYIVYTTKNKDDFAKILLWIINCSITTAGIKIWKTKKSKEIIDFHRAMYHLIKNKGRYWDFILPKVIQRVKIQKFPLIDKVVF